MAIDMKRFHVLEQNVTGNTASVHEAGKTLLSGIEEILREAHATHDWHQMGHAIELLGERKSALAAGLQVGMRGQFADTEATTARPADVRDERSARDLPHDPAADQKPAPDAADAADATAQSEFNRGAGVDQPAGGDEYNEDGSPKK